MDDLVCTGCGGELVYRKARRVLGLWESDTVCEKCSRVESGVSRRVWKIIERCQDFHLFNYCETKEDNNRALSKIVKMVIYQYRKESDDGE